MRNVFQNLSLIETVSLTILISGCAIFDPGGAARKAALQEDWTVTNQEGIDVQHGGTHAKSIFWAKGSNLKAATNEDGEVVPDLVNSEGITDIYYSRPDTTGIQAIMGQMAEMGVQQQKLVGQQFEALLRLALMRGESTEPVILGDSDEEQVDDN